MKGNRFAEVFEEKNFDSISPEDSMKKLERLSPSERRKIDSRLILDKNLLHYYIFEEIFIKFYLFDERMVRRYRDQYIYIKNYQKDQLLCSRLDPANELKGLGKMTKKKYSSTLKQLRSFFKHINRQLAQIIPPKLNEIVFFRVFEKNEKSLKLWSLMKQFFDRINPLDQIFDLIVNQKKMTGISTVELKNFAEHLTKEYQS